MGSRRKGQRQEFDRDSNEPVPPQADDFTREFFGLEEKPKVPPGEPELFPITQIYPDPIQPRRTMPEDLRADWLTGTPLPTLFKKWQARVQNDFRRAGLPAHLATAQHYISESEVDTEFLESGPEIHIPPTSEQWIALVRLAASIKTVGLEQPVTLYPTGDHYTLIVGERRLLAFHLLTSERYEGFDQIPALKRDGPNLWSQAFENNARQNLNAISKARQLALLLMALNQDWPEQIMGAQPDQAWYAHAVDLRVPYGKAEAIATVLGLPGPVDIRRYRRLLRLENEVWKLADQLDWHEDKIARILRASGNDSYGSVRIARIEAGLDPAPRPVPATIEVKAQQWVSGVIRGKALDTDQLTPPEKEAAIHAIEAAREMLDELELQLKGQ